MTNLELYLGTWACGLNGGATHVSYICHLLISAFIEPFAMILMILSAIMVAELVEALAVLA